MRCAIIGLGKRDARKTGGSYASSISCQETQACLQELHAQKLNAQAGGIETGKSTTVALTKIMTPVLIANPLKEKKKTG